MRVCAPAMSKNRRTQGWASPGDFDCIEYEEQHMRIAAIVLATFLGFVLFGVQPIGQNQSSSCTAVKEALDELTQIKVGMTRREIEKQFRLDGGLQLLPSAIYLYPKCRYIQIKVDYKLTKGDESPNDKVIAVSEPILGYPAKD
jgi:hypothetical protein